MTKRDNNKTAYLSGSMEFAPNEGIRWRRVYEKILLEKCNIKSIIPNDEEKEIKKQYDMNELKKTDLSKYIEIMRQFIEADLKFVETVDIIIVRWRGEQTSGTIHEVGHAYKIGKPCYLVTSLKPVDIPGWFLACFNKIFPNLKSLVNYLNQ